MTGKIKVLVVAVAALAAGSFVSEPADAADGAASYCIVYSEGEIDCNFTSIARYEETRPSVISGVTITFFSAVMLGSLGQAVS